MLMGLISFMTGSDRTTGSVSTSSTHKKRLAIQSATFNLAHKGFINSFSII